MDKKEKHKYFVKFYLNDLSKRDLDQLNNLAEADRLFLKQWESTHDLEVRDLVINKKELFEQIYFKIHKRNQSLQPFLKIAASVLFFIALAFAGIFISLQISNKNLVEYQTDAGERKDIILPDGTTAWLHSNTRLIYKTSFGRRQITLDGEAYFEVVNNGHSFIVHTNYYTVEVLGTKFIVNAYSSKVSSYTILKEGKIKINCFEKEEIVMPNEIFSLNKLLKTTEIRKTELEAYISWIDNRLVFDNTSLLIIIEQLSKWYGIEIKTENTINLDKKYTLTVIDETPEEVFALFNEITPIICTKQNNHYTLSLPK